MLLELFKAIPSCSHFVCSIVDTAIADSEFVVWSILIDSMCTFGTLATHAYFSVNSCLVNAVKSVFKVVFSWIPQAKADGSYIHTLYEEFDRTGSREQNEFGRSNLEWWIFLLEFVVHLSQWCEHISELLRCLYFLSLYHLPNYPMIITSWGLPWNVTVVKVHYTLVCQY